MSTLPWGTMNDWLRLEVEQRAATAQRRLNSQFIREARRTQAAPIAPTTESTPPTTSGISRSDCTEAA